MPAFIALLWLLLLFGGELRAQPSQQPIDTLRFAVPHRFANPDNKMRVADGLLVIQYANGPYLRTFDLQAPASDTGQLVILQETRQAGTMLDVRRMTDGQWEVISSMGCTSLLRYSATGQLREARKAPYRKRVFASYYSRFQHLSAALPNEEGYLLACFQGFSHDKMLAWAHTASKIHLLSAKFRPVRAVDVQWPDQTGVDMSLLAYQIQVITSPQGSILALDARYPIVQVWDGSGFRAIAPQLELFDTAAVNAAKPHHIALTNENLMREFMDESLADTLTQNLRHEYEALLPLHLSNGWYGLVYRKPVPTGAQTGLALLAGFSLEPKVQQIHLPRFACGNFNNRRSHFALHKPLAVVLFDEAGVVQAHFDLPQSAHWAQQVGDELWLEGGYDAQTQQLLLVRYPLLAAFGD